METNWPAVIAGSSGAIVTGLIFLFNLKKTKKEAREAANKAEQEAKALNPQANDQPDSPRLSSLDNAKFVTEYTQGHMVDRGVLTLHTESGNRLVGDYKLYYQFLDQQGEKQYPTFPDHIKVTGSFLHDTVIALTFDNKDIKKKHVGTELLTYDATGRHLTGYFTVYHDPIPKERQSQESRQRSNCLDTGWIELWRCEHEDQIEDFLHFKIPLSKIIDHRNRF